MRARLALSHVFVLLVAQGTVQIGIQLMKGPNRKPFDADVAIRFGMLTGAVTALVVGVLLSRFLLRPLDDVRAATHRLAQGHYGDVLAVPDDPELSGLVGDVNTLASALADTERRRARLVSEIAHEMKTPITILRGQIEGLADGIFPPDEAMFASLTDDLARLERLASDLSSLSVAEEGAFVLHRRPADVTALVRAVAERLRPQYDDHRVTLSVGTPTPPIAAEAGTSTPPIAAEAGTSTEEAGTPAPLIAECDPDRITQVLVNLLGNALGACDPGGRVWIGVSALATPHPHVRVQVADDGIGIDAADLDRIFSRFERVGHPGRPAPSGGSGIGLTIARGIARAHDGEVVAASAGPGRGAMFTLTIPVRGLPPTRQDVHDQAFGSGDQRDAGDGHGGRLQ
ncbi:HAMP domain-containing sensor histidine kinase [Actinoplanes sp. NPDC051851]|uniref:sensor histidine kinase n=1 Tax=Actinoplanes sp. NPDC051851 TaxID=3154753 RepID=UPI00341DE10E